MFFVVPSRRARAMAARNDLIDLLQQKMEYLVAIQPSLSEGDYAGTLTNASDELLAVARAQGAMSTQAGAAVLRMMLNSPFDQTVKSAIATIVNQKVASGNNLFGRRRLPGQQHAAAAGGSAHQNCDTFYNFVPKQMWEMIQ